MRKFEIVSSYENQGITLPKRATQKSAGYDLASAETIVIEKGKIKLIPTGLKAKFPAQETLMIYARSSLATRGLMMSNGVGVVDADYYDNPQNEGHLMVPLYNFSETDVIIEKGDRVAQGIFMPYYTTTDDDAEQKIRLGGFGSSGK